MKTISLYLMVLVTLTAGARASDQVPAPRQNHAIALTGGTIHTVSGDVVEGGTIVFDNGRITAVGSNASLPGGVESITIDGKHVYPGLIAANTVLGLVEVAALRPTRDYAETGAITPNVRAEVSINPDSELLPVTRANGTLLALSIPMGGVIGRTRGGTITGTSALIMLDGWTWEDMTFEAPVGMHVFWPKMLVGDGPRAKEARKNRDETIESIHNAVADARAYLKARAAGSHDSDLRWEAMAPVIRGEIPLFVHAEGVRDIEAAVEWASSEGLRVVIVGGSDAAYVTDLLVENNVSVIVGGIHRVPARRWEDYDAPFALPLRLKEAGVRFCIATRGGSFGSAHVRNLPYHAAMAAAYGLSKEDALRSITLSAAEILGVADRVGSLDVGKDATLIVTDGDPLEITTNVEMAFIQGRQIDLESRHTQLYRKYQAKYRQITQPAGTLSAGSD